MKKTILFAFVVISLFTLIFAGCMPTGAKITPSDCGSDSACLACINKAHYCSGVSEMAYGYANGVCTKGYVWTSNSPVCTASTCDCNAGSSSSKSCLKVGETTCSGNGYYKCNLKDSMAYTTCSSGQVCSNGKCVSGSIPTPTPTPTSECVGVNYCNIGESSCSDIYTLQYCYKNPSNNCRIWHYASCPSGQSCQSGDCVASSTPAPSDPCSTMNCNDNDLCTSDSCSNSQCVYTPITCNTGSYCDAGSCVPFPSGCTSDSACDDNNANTDDKCGTDGKCVNTIKSFDFQEFLKSYGVILAVGFLVIVLVIYYLMTKKRKR